MWLRGDTDANQFKEAFIKAQQDNEGLFPKTEEVGEGKD